MGWVVGVRLLGVGLILEIGLVKFGLSWVG